MVKTYFTADHHFDHARIIEYAGRRFASVERMNQAMLQRWNETVGPEDTVYHLGDFALASAGRIAELVAALNGYKIVIVGNHDRSPKRMVELGFDEAYREAEYEGWRLVHEPPGDPGRRTLCAHVHGLWSWRGTMQYPQINVGVDVCGYRPRTLQEIAGCAAGSSRATDDFSPEAL